MQMTWKTVFVMLAVGALVDSSGFGNMCRMYGLDEIADEVDEKCDQPTDDAVSRSTLSEITYDYVIEQNVDDAIQCLRSVIDLDDIGTEFSDDIRNRTILPFFQKYCHKTSKLKPCIDQLYAAVGICLRPFVQEDINGLNKATKDVVDFICYNDGERINSLVTAGGMECIVDKDNELMACVDTQNFEYPQSHKDNCRVFADIQRCIISTLETCATPSAANLAKSFFRMVKQSHTCPVKILLYMGIA